jgi:2-haloacid dehalogenase
MAFDSVKALTFDVFGTVVDWRGTLVRAGERLAELYNLKVDWRAVADRWREKYAQAVQQGGPWRPLDEILAQAGRELLDESHIDSLSKEDREWWISLWGRLDPWPDSVPGLTRLRERYRLVALSNANGALGKALAEHAGLPWDQIVAPDPVQAYKPDPRVYCLALRQLGLEGHEVMMVAAHLYDLEGAKALGYRTAFVRRPGEEPDDPDQAPYVEFSVNDFQELATILLT